MRRWLRPSLGKVTALCTLCGVVVVLVANGQEMFSPGKLNAQSRKGTRAGGVMAHADLGGNCAACHAPPWSGETMASRCLDCHKDVRQEIDSGRSLHGRMPEPMECRTCHTEHNGAHAALTSLARFDHAWTSAQTCASCHAEPVVHKGRFGTTCGSCHATNTWTNLTPFDHSQTAYKLTGKHQTTDCRSCHVNHTFKGTPQTCVSCHAEPKFHKGFFGTDCARCHTTSTWEANFAHSFPIGHGGAGKKGNACAACHTTPNDFQTYTCYGCHRHEPAAMIKRHPRVPVAKLDKCADCHPTGRGAVKRAEVDILGDALCLGCPQERGGLGDLRSLLEAPDPWKSFATGGCPFSASR